MQDQGNQRTIRILRCTETYSNLPQPSGRNQQPHAVTRRVPRTFILAVVVISLLALDGLLLYKRSAYRDETARLRAGMTELERARADAIVAAESDRTGLMLQFVRRQATQDDALHLAVSSESSFVALDRGGVRLRTMPAEFGPERRVGVPPDTVMVTVPRGMRVVERRLGATDRFELPVWLWTDRGLPQATDRAEPGWAGADAIVTSGGTLVYARPASGPLADSTYVMPGAVRISRADLTAIRDNITPGMRVYFF